MSFRKPPSGPAPGFARPGSPRERYRSRRAGDRGPTRRPLRWLALAVVVAAGAAWLGVRLRVPGQAPDGLVYSAPPGPYLEDRIARVIDGDTVVGERLGRIRYIGINTPETDARDPAVRAMARQATQVNRRLVEGKRVQLVLDVQERDRYGRLLAYVWADGVFVNAYLVAEGYAQVMTVPPNVRYQDPFLALQRRAREERRGFWSEPRPWR